MGEPNTLSLRIWISEDWTSEDVLYLHTHTEKFVHKHMHMHVFMHVIQQGCFSCHTDSECLEGDILNGYIEILESKIVVNTATFATLLIKLALAEAKITINTNLENDFTYLTGDSMASSSIALNARSKSSDFLCYL